MSRNIRGNKGTPSSVMPNYIVNWEEITTLLDGIPPRYYKGFREVEGVRKEKGYIYTPKMEKSKVKALELSIDTSIVLTNIDIQDEIPNTNNHWSVFLNNEKVIENISLSKGSNKIDWKTITPLHEGDKIVVEKSNLNEGIKGSSFINVGYIDIMSTIEDMEEIE